MRLQRLQRSLWRSVVRLHRERPPRHFYSIPEGAIERELPLKGHGTIRSRPNLRETYATVSRDGVRLFMAWGAYNGPEDKKIYRRHWWNLGEFR